MTSEGANVVHVVGRQGIDDGHLPLERLSRPTRILLLDDHDGSRLVMRYALTALGYDCLAVGDTLAALTITGVFEPHAILYEWSTRSGERAGLSFRFRDRLPERALSVVILSALDEPDDFRSREEIDAYLIKPLAPRDLASTLSKCCFGTRIAL